MKIHPVHFILATVFIISCNKNDNTTMPDPTKGKKWIVTTIAGDGIAHFTDGPALMAGFKAPQDVTVTPDGGIYVADAINHRIRKIAGSTVTTYAGSGADDTISGRGDAAAFALPIQITNDLSGNLYTLDVDDFRIRKISSSALVTVVAGSGERGFADGNAATARFGESIGIAADNQGNLYVSDNENKRIRKISNSGLVTTIAGNGKAAYVDGSASKAEFFSPTGIVIDRQGNLFVADYNHVRKITPDGTVSTFAGNNTPGYMDGPANVARFSFINDMAIDASGNIYLSDDNRIRKITSHGDVTTIAGSSAGYSDGDGTSAKFNNPDGLGIDGQGNIYVADDNNNRIRKISFE
jgi:sugar lactone lactonase YvrE